MSPACFSMPPGFFGPSLGELEKPGQPEYKSQGQSIPPLPHSLLLPHSAPQVIFHFPPDGAGGFWLSWAGWWRLGV